MPFANIMNLRDANETVNMLPWQVEELRKCALDPMYFINNYLYITTKDHGIQLFKMWDFQKEAIKKFHKHRFTVLKFPRQCGKSTTTRAYLLWYAMFSPNKLIAILGNKLSLAKEQLQLLRDSYISLPYWMQLGVKSWNKLTVEFSNGTRIFVAATSPDNIRGMAISLLYLDEFAFIKSHIADEFIASVFPTISSGKTTKCIITSTPNGMNQFYRIWQDAIEESTLNGGTSEDFVRFEIKWNDVPGRDEHWAQSELKRIGEIRFNQEYKCEFIGSISTLIDHTFLKQMKAQPPIDLKNLPSYIKIWNLPIPKHIMDQNGWEYVASLDSGYGIRQDATVLQITLVKSNITIHQVAKMSADYMEIDKFAATARELLRSYYDPNLIVEQNGPGASATSYFMNTVEYENILHFDPKGQHMGLWANDIMKSNAVLLLKAYVQRGFLKVVDQDTIDELLSFGKISVSKWGAMGGNHDDHVTSLYWIPYYCNSPLFYGNQVEVNLQKLMEDEIIIPIGNMSDEEKHQVFTSRDVDEAARGDMDKIMNAASEYINRSNFYGQPPEPTEDEDDEGGGVSFVPR